MDFLGIILGIFAFVAIVVAIISILDAIGDSDPGMLFVTLVAIVVATACGFGANAAWGSYASNWHSEDAVVRTVFIEDGSTVLLTNKGSVYRCVDAAQCAKLVKGDHITFERLPKGSGIKDTADVRNVTKG